MPRMIELIKQSAVPANVVRSAARGALTLPAGEMIEILVYLTSNPLFAEQAKMTLAGWDEASALAAAQDPNTPWEVLSYWIAPENLRPKLAPALFDNRSVREAALVELAQKNSREIIQLLLQSARVRRSPEVLHSLLSNPALSDKESAEIHALLKARGEETQQIQAYEEPRPESPEQTQWELDHAAEIAAEDAENKPFMFFSGDMEDENPEELESVAPVDETAEPSGGEPAQERLATPDEPNQAAEAAEGTTVAPASAATAVPKKDAGGGERLSTLQKIAKLGVGQRIQLAMKGNKEERFILVRDGSKLVSQAVLQSPKLTDAEVETFAGMKNVQEGVLREIARNHKFMKNYGVVRTLVNNPRSPLDLSLTLINHLHVNDLKSASMNKNLPDTLRKLSLKRFKDKTEKKASTLG